VGDKMKRRMLKLLICLLIILPILPVNLSADQTPQLEIAILGSLRLLGTDRVGGIIVNVGNTTAYDVYYNFTVKGGFDNSIDFMRQGYAGDIPGREGDKTHSFGVVFPRQVYGFGPIVITMAATSSNAEDITHTVQGFQMGYFTLVFGR